MSNDDIIANLHNQVVLTAVE